MIVLAFFLSFICFSSQLNIKSDEESSNILLSVHSDVNIFKSYRYLVYDFSLKAMNNTINWYPEVMKKCKSQNITVLRALSQEVEHNVLWDSYSPMILKRHEYSNIQQSLNSVQLLQRNLYELSKRSGDSRICYELPRIERDFIDLNRIFNSLYFHNRSAIFDIIDEKLIKFDLQSNLSNLVEGLSVPFDFSHNFGKTFLEHARVEWYHDNFSVSLLLEIPIYEKVKLFNYHPKPIVRNDTLYVLNTNESFLVERHGESIFYNNITFNSFCFTTKNEKFCTRPFGTWTCETDHLYGRDDRTYCWKRLKNHNSITQFGTDTYLMLTSPIILYVNCDKFEFILQLFNSTKFANNKRCFVNTTFFTYSPINPQYGTFFSNLTDGKYDSTKYTNLELEYTILQTLISGILYALSICPLIYFYKRKIRLIKERGEVSIVLPSEFEPYLRGTNEQLKFESVDCSELWYSVPTTDL